MPTVPLSTTVLDTRANAVSVVWSPLTQADPDGAPWDMAGLARTMFVTVRGTFGAGGTLVFQGSADGVQWATMIQVNNSLASFTAAGGTGLRGCPRFVRPLVTVSDASTSLTVTLYATAAVPDV